MGGELAYIAELLLSELVTNAVQASTPGATPLGIRFALVDGRLRLAGRDGSDEQPVMNRDTEEDKECGHGLVLVDALAHGWGVDRRATGKTVWAEVAVTVRGLRCR
nr:ATP-binding protein [Streptomyces chattanoogensis]